MGIESNQELLRQELRCRYGVGPASVRFVFAPYRICPLGAHIDHQLGQVTALAIERGVLLAYTPAVNREVRVGSLEYPGEIRFPVDQPAAPQPGDWGNYARGAVHALAQARHQRQGGMTGVITGPWSEGGLSSSAAVGVAYLLALEDVNGLKITSGENIRLDQAIENEYLGLRNGILDQSGILLSRKNHLTLMDCATGEHRLISAGALANSWSILLAFSGLTQALVGTDYNRRVGECAEAARILLAAAGRSEKNPVLACVTEHEYTEHKKRLPAPLDRRAAHYFGETARVRDGVNAWQHGDLRKFGQLMTASGESSIHNYECGCPALIELYEILVRCPGVYGARFSGAGFRGCCIALADRAAATQATQEITQRYAERQPKLSVNATVVIVDSDDGARIMTGV